MNNHQSLYLAHHGVMGQKWGERNGPPYPLTPGAHSRAEVRANWKQSLSSKHRRAMGSTDTEFTEKAPVDHMKVLSDEDRKKAIHKLKIRRAVGIPVAVLGRPVAGISMFVDANKALRDDSKALKLDAKYQAERDKNPIDSKTGMRLKQSDMSMEEDIKRVNPLYKDISQQSKSNCVLCSVTYDLRRRGYDVTAQGAGFGYENDEVTNWYKDKISYKEIDNVKKNKVSPENIISALSSAGGRGIVNVFWPGGGGHAMAYDTEGGSLKIIDAQSGDIYTPDKIKKAFKHGTGAEYARTDNLKIDAKEMLKEVCKN